ncbi:MAG: hypothetical protein Q9211_002955 [Gyalolechia sp. 1 TL-2023]
MVGISFTAIATSVALFSTLRPAVCFAAAAPAGPARVETPRYYFPRQIKRIVTNSSTPVITETTQTTVEQTTITAPSESLLTSILTATSSLPNGDEITQVLTTTLLNSADSSEDGESLEPAESNIPSTPSSTAATIPIATPSATTTPLAATISTPTATPSRSAPTATPTTPAPNQPATTTTEPDGDGAEPIPLAKSAEAGNVGTGSGPQTSASAGIVPSQPQPQTMQGESPGSAQPLVSVGASESLGLLGGSGAGPTSDGISVAPSTPTTPSNGQTTFANDGAATMSNAGSQVTPTEQPIAIPAVISNDQTTFTTFANDGAATISNAGSQVTPTEQPIAVPAVISNDQTTFTTFINDGAATMSNTGSQVTPTEQPIAVPAVISNDQITFTTFINDGAATMSNAGSQVTPTEQPIAGPAVISNDQTTFTTFVNDGAATISNAGSQVTPTEQPIAVPAVISNDQTTFTTFINDGAATISNTGSQVTPTEQPIAVPAVISNDQTTFTTFANDGAATISNAGSQVTPTEHPIAVPAVVSNDQTTFTTEEPATLLPGTGAAAATGSGIPVVPATPLLSTAITPTVGQGSANTEVPTANTGAAPSGEDPSVIVLPTTKPATGSIVSPLVTPETSITGSLPVPPISSGSVIFGPNNVITPTSAGANTAVTGTASVGSPLPSSGATSLNSGITNPAASGTGTAASITAQDGSSSGSGQATDASSGSLTTNPTSSPATSQGVSQSNVGDGSTIPPSGSPTSQGVSQSSAGANETTGQGVSQSNVGDGSTTAPSGSATSLGVSQSNVPDGSPVTPSGTVTVSSTGLVAGGNSVTPPSTPIIPQYTQTGSPAPITYSATPGAPTSQRPIGSDKLTVVTVPTSLIYADPAPQPTQTTEFIPAILPSSVPPLIQPPDGMPSQPEDTARIQVGFLQALNYAFVVNSQVTQQQIFDFLPPGIAYGLGIPVANVTMETLKADDTSTDLPYIRTLALAFIPKDQVNTLYLNLHTPAHRIYRNPNATVAQLMSFVDPSVGIQADNPMTPSGPGFSGSAQPTPSNPAKGGAPIGGGIGNDKPVRKSSVAIGVGVVCGAAAYGAAMFFIARRYKRRRQSHGRSPSMFSSPVYSGSRHDFMGGANDALMSGAMREDGRSTSPMDGYGYGRNSRGSGRSGSTGRQQISAPVMAENSLGWN